MKNAITVIGSMNYDMILKVKRLPQKGETMTADGFNYSAGGKGANQAAQAAKLGIKTYLGACVGCDSMGEYLIKSAEKNKVDISYIRRSEENTGLGVVESLEDGSVYATIVRGANYSLNRKDIESLEPALLESALLILQMEIPLEMNYYAIEKAKKCGCKIMMNAAPASAMEESYLRKCDYVVVNEVEAAFFCGTPVDSIEKAENEIFKLCRKYDNNWIFTLGAAGSVVCDGKTAEFIPSKKVNAVETTGAGDSYIGGLSYALLNGKDIFEAGKFATSCSAVTVGRIGAQDSMPGLNEAMEIYEKN